MMMMLMMMMISFRAGGNNVRVSVRRFRVCTLRVDPQNKITGEAVISNRGGYQKMLCF
jgi:hypothetical protein